MCKLELGSADLKGREGGGGTGSQLVAGTVRVSPTR